MPEHSEKVSVTVVDQHQIPSSVRIQIFEREGPHSLGSVNYHIYNHSLTEVVKIVTDALRKHYGGPDDVVMKEEGTVARWEHAYQSRL